MALSFHADTGGTRVAEPEGRCDACDEALSEDRMVIDDHGQFCDAYCAADFRQLHGIEGEDV
jgi:hypothetical protein